MSWAGGMFVLWFLPMLLIAIVAERLERRERGKRDDIVAERRRRIERDGYFVRSGYTRMIDRRWPR